MTSTLPDAFILYSFPNRLNVLPFSPTFASGYGGQASGESPYSVRTEYAVGTTSAPLVG
jgi:hypothetical protein